MTVQPTITEVVYQLTGTALGPFNTTFGYAAASEVTAWLDIADGNGPRQLASPADYTVADSLPTLTNGGNLTLSASTLGVLSSWPAGAVLGLKRQTSVGQPSAFGEAVAFSSAASEAALDNVDRQIQDLYATTARSLSLPIGDISSPILASAAARAGKVLIGDPLTGALKFQAFPAGGPVQPAGFLQFNSLAALRSGGTGAAFGSTAMVTGFDGTGATAMGGGVFTCQGAIGLADDGGDIIVAGANVWVRQTDCAVSADFGTVGDGVTDDWLALQTWLSAGSTSGFRSYWLSPVRRGSKGYLISNTLVVTNPSTPPIIPCNIYFNATLIAAPSFPPGVAMLHTSANNCDLYTPSFNGGQTGTGSNYAYTALQISASNLRVHSPRVIHVYGRGIDVVSGSSGIIIRDPDIRQWNNNLANDPEFATQANFTADGIFWNTFDGAIEGGSVEWCGVPLHFGENSGTTHVRGVHPFNGASGQFGGPFTIVSGTYNNATGVVILTMSSAVTTAGVGGVFNLSGLTGTGAFASLAGSYQALAGTAGTTVEFNAGAGLGAAAITGGQVTTGPFVDPIIVLLEDGANGIFFHDCYLDEGLFVTYSPAFAIYNPNPLQSSVSGCVFTSAAQIHVIAGKRSHPFQSIARFTTQSLAANNNPVNPNPTQMIAFDNGPVIALTGVAPAAAAGTAVAPNTPSAGQATYAVAAFPILPAVGNTVTMAGYGTGGNNGTFTVLASSPLGVTVSNGSASASGAMGTITINGRVTYQVASWPHGTPDVGVPMIVAGNGTGGYNGTQNVIASHQNAGGGDTIPNCFVALNGTTAAVGALGTAQATWLGDFSGVTPLLASSFSQFFEMDGGTFHFWPESAGGNFSHVEYAPSQTLQELYVSGDASNPMSRTFIAGASPIVAYGAHSLRVTQIQVGSLSIAGGTGYSAGSYVQFLGGGGAGATASVTIVNGVPTSITLTKPGNGYYNAAPVATLIDPMGLGSGAVISVNMIGLGGAIGAGNSAAVSPAIVSGAYTSGTGAVSLTLAVAKGFVAGTTVILSGLTGTGAFASLNGAYVATAGTTGLTVNLTAASGLGATTITGGTCASKIDDLSLVTDGIGGAWLRLHNALMWQFTSTGSPATARTQAPVVDNFVNLGTAALALSNIYAHNALNVVSDMTLKTLRPEPVPGLDFVLALAAETIAFQFDSDPAKALHFGFPAQGVRQVMDAFGLPSDAAMHGVDPESGRQTLQKEEMLPALFLAIAALTRRIQVLEGDLRGSSDWPGGPAS